MGERLTIAQACVLADVSPSTMERRIASGKIRVLRSDGGRDRFLDSDDVKALFELKYATTNGGKE